MNNEQRIKGERTIVAKLICAILSRKYLVSIFDGEAFAIQKSDSYQNIMAEVMSTDADTVRVWSKDGEMIGAISLIYGNSPEEVIADYSDNEEIGAIIKEVEAY